MHRPYPHHYDTSPVSSPFGSADVSVELPKSPARGWGDGTNHPPSTQDAHNNVAKASTPAQTRDPSSLVAVTRSISHAASLSSSANPKQAEPADPRMEAGQSGQGKREERREEGEEGSLSPVDALPGGETEKERGASGSPHGERADVWMGTEASEQAAAAGEEAESSEGRESPSPFRRRRLSLSRSAEAKEDERERGKAIIAVDQETAVGLLRAQARGLESAEREERARGDDSTSSTRGREDATSESDGERARMKRNELPGRGERRLQRGDPRADQGLDRSCGDSQGQPHEGDVSLSSSSEFEDEGEGTNSPLLKDRQRRHLSLSQSAAVASVDTPEDDGEERGLTSVKVAAAAAGGSSAEGGNGGREAGGAQASEQKKQGDSVATQSKQANSRTARRLSVAGLSSERTQDNFEDKKVEKHGQAAQQDSLSQFGIGMCCKKGFKPESPNQDDFFIIKVDKWCLYGAFDGHGPFGHDVSNYVQRELPARLLYGEPPFLSSPLRALHASFTKVHNELEDQTDAIPSGGQGIDCSMSGTTATVVLHIHAQKKLFVAHVGDSRAVIGRREPPFRLLSSTGRQVQGRPSWEGAGHGSPDPLQASRDAGAERGDRSLIRLRAMDLTVDHKPTNELEKQRIIKSGGQVRRLEGDVPHRVFLKNRLFPGLAMSRAIGDTIATQAGVIPDPEVREYQLVDGRDEFLLICSDGVWEFISSQEAVNMVGSFGRERVSFLSDPRRRKRGFDASSRAPGVVSIDACRER
ncbi:putative PP2C [Besnoitia besnoiti]|uniref:Putative PP2C n=1 Tax=Besnoitia besnoiti TaxID=94643 RepID=A0A2A9LX83_BESBE|nr:putative PP2C [Besnoitia besnoiti]PFH31098.1 putative PP2C [Besnoitia besnoiti]